MEICGVWVLLRACNSMVPLVLSSEHCIALHCIVYANNEETNDRIFKKFLLYSHIAGSNLRNSGEKNVVLSSDSQICA